MQTLVRVAITGAAGSIGYALVFRAANGDLFGPERPIALQLLEIGPAMSALEGVAMELADGAFPLLEHVVLSDDPRAAFRGANWALLVGARPRGKGMERSDLLQANAPIFVAQGAALNREAAADVRVAVVGNPANTNCLIAMSLAPDIPADRFSAMMRLDHNRAVSQLAAKTGSRISQVTRVTVWGNHSSTQYPDAYHAMVAGRPAPEVVGDDGWIRDQFMPMVQQRGAAVIAARGASSAASAANALINHVQAWDRGTPAGDWVSMAVPSTGAYDTPAGVVFGYPVTIRDGVPQVVTDLALSAFDRECLRVTGEELLQERDAIAPMLRA